MAGPIVPCTEVADEDRKTHAWKSTGLDIVNEVLCTTRRCVWCGTQQHKRYGAGGRRPWRTS